MRTNNKLNEEDRKVLNGITLIFSYFVVCMLFLFALIKVIDFILKHYGQC